MTTTRPDGLTLRPVDPASDEALAWRRTAGLVFKDSAPVTTETVEWRRPDWAAQRLTAMWDDDEVVGTFRSWDTTLTVPGGAVAADAISSVTVRPTHRRRGVLSAMIRADLAEAARRGLPAAMLIASEATIYGRFGFGPSTRTATWRVDVRGATVRPGAPTGGRTRIVDAETFVAAAPGVYRASRQPGAMDLTERWWRQRTGLEPMPGSSPQATVHVLHLDDDGRPDGLLRYRPEDRWEERTINTVVHVDVLVADGAAAYADLVRYLTELDTVATVRLEERPLDERLPHLLVDARAARVVSVCDLLWTRLLDVPAALAARTWSAPAALTLTVHDPDGWAGGTWRLEAGPDGATCEPTQEPPDVETDVDVLSSVWLGGGDLLAAAAAGRVAGRSPEAVGRLATALRTSREPWTWTWF